MARNTSTETEAQASADNAAPAAEGTTAAASTSGARPRISFKIRTVGEGENAKNYSSISGFEDGKEVTRQEYITKRWTQDGVDRGQIAKELTDLEGKKVPYQIVFQGTKGKTQAGKEAPAAAPVEGSSEAPVSTEEAPSA